MSTELKQAAQQALKELDEARKIIRASSSRQLAKDWDRRATAVLAELRTAIQQTEAKVATASACNIPGMVKTTCPYCDQEFAFEHERPVTPEPIGQVFYAADGDDETGAGYCMKPYVHWFGKASAADTKRYYLIQEYVIS